MMFLVEDGVMGGDRRGGGCPSTRRPETSMALDGDGRKVPNARVPVKRRRSLRLELLRAQSVSSVCMDGFVLRGVDGLKLSTPATIPSSSIALRESIVFQ
mmetsp:Transcript_64647/g.75864  ORF Transcript_64647/g.75864 Transcript_64647/m.75864 type:complete len:100 (-) Transcript_64647:106-405(-)